MKIKYFSSGLVFMALLCSGMVIGVEDSFAVDDSVVDQIDVTVSISCTMDGTGMDTHSANIQNGEYTSNIGSTVLHVFCNDNEGFAIYAAGYTGDTVGGTNSTKLVGAPSIIGSIDTGTATSAGNPDVSNWAMKLAISQDSGDTAGTNAVAIDNGFNNYHVVPNEYTKVVHKNAMTDMTAVTGGVKLTTTYGAYISRTQSAGTYTGQVVYTLVHPSSAEAPVVSLCPNSVPGITYMQDINASNKAAILVSMVEDQQYCLVDSRDGTVYSVAKLRDGNLWMTQNLELGSTGSLTVLNDTTSAVSSSGYSFMPIDSTYKGNSNKYGNLYSYTDATADSLSDRNLDAPYSICPKNWRLPSIGGDSDQNNDFYNLLSHYITSGTLTSGRYSYGMWKGAEWSGVTMTELTNSAISVVYSGDYYVLGDEVEGRGEFGGWWSSTRGILSGDTNSRYLLFFMNNGTVSTGGDDDLGAGYAVRCLISGS